MTPYQDAIVAYEALYKSGKPRSLGKGGGTGPATYDGEALAALARYALDLATSPYEIAMWRRREWQHVRGKHGDIYDGKDALEWLHTMEAHNWDTSTLRIGSRN